MRTGTQPINPHGHRSAVTQREPRRDCFASTGLPAMTSCHGLRLLASLLPPIRVASRHAARVGDERDHRGEDRGDGAGDHGLHRFPPLAWALGRRDPGRAGPSPARRREPSARAPPTHAAALALLPAKPRRNEEGSRELRGNPHQSGAQRTIYAGFRSGPLRPRSGGATEPSFKRLSTCGQSCKTQQD